jgi:hypothetical protein
MCPNELRGTVPLRRTGLALPSMAFQQVGDLMNLAPWLPVANACHSVGEIWMIWLKLEFRRFHVFHLFKCILQSRKNSIPLLDVHECSA